MKSSIDDVAKKAGVSVVTVSRVINNITTVRKNNRDRVLRAMEELNYTPSAAAQTLALGKTKVVGLTINNLNDSFMEGVVNSLNKNLEKYGYFMALSVIPEETSSLKSNGGFIFQSDRVDGVILLTPINEEVDIKDLEGKGIPYVLLDNQQEQVNGPSVVVNNYKGGYDATQHLINLGHEKIAHISGPTLYLSSKERKRGYIAAMKDAGIEQCMIESSDFSIRGGFDVTNEWIKNGNVPTAVFAADDFIALGVINALNGKGWKVPDDVSVVGFDDQSFASEIHPRITTVKQPEEQIGVKAVELLITLIDGSIKKYEKVVLDPQLLIRESTSYKPVKRENR